MKKFIIPFFLLLLLFGCFGGKSNLSISVLNISPEHRYEGDTMTFTVNVVNSGDAAANDVTVDLSVNNISVKTTSISLAPNSNTTVSFSWVPLTAGSYYAVAKVDSGNVVSGPSAEKESSTQLSISPSEENDVFSIIPSKSVINVGLIDVKKEGLNAVYSYSPAMPELPSYFSFLRPYVKNSKEVKIGTVDYADASRALILFIDGPSSVGQISGLVSLLTNATFTAQNKMINGVEVSVLSSDELGVPVCVWREKGWLKLLLYQELISYQSCEDVFGTYNPAYINGMLNGSKELASPLPFNSTFLGSTQHLSNLTRLEYGAAFEDDEGFYGFYAVNEPYTPQNYSCLGRIANRSMMQLCETMPSANDTWTWAQRNVGNYSLICLSVPKANDSSIAIEMKALDICYSFNFSGEERTWQKPDVLRPAMCEFSDTFKCSSYDFSNGTFRLNLTQNSGRTIVINGFKCSSEPLVPTEHFQLNQPITLKSNSTVHLEYPCYDMEGAPMLENYAYFNSRMYLNYSFEGSIESNIIRGSLTIRKI